MMVRGALALPGAVALEAAGIVRRLAMGKAGSNKRVFIKTVTDGYRRSARAGLTSTLDHHLFPAHPIIRSYLGCR
jgi:hypothetical protein